MTQLGHMHSGFRKILFFDIGGVLPSKGLGHESRQVAATHFGFDYSEMNCLHEFIFNVYEIGNINLTKEKSAEGHSCY